MCKKSLLDCLDDCVISANASGFMCPLSQTCMTDLDQCFCSGNGSAPVWPHPQKHVSQWYRPFWWRSLTIVLWVANIQHFCGVSMTSSGDFQTAPICQRAPCDMPRCPRGMLACPNDRTRCVSDIRSCVTACGSSGMFVCPHGGNCVSSASECFCEPGSVSLDCLCSLTGAAAMLMGSDFSHSAT